MLPEDGSVFIWMLLKGFRQLVVHCCHRLVSTRRSVAVVAGIKIKGSIKNWHNGLNVITQDSTLYFTIQ